MPARRVIVHVDCVTCRVKLPLGGVTSSVTCNTCQWTADLPPERWRWVLDGMDRTVTAMETILGETTTSIVGCPSCHAPLSDDAIADAVTSASSSIACSKCASVLALRGISEASLGMATHYSAAIGEGAVHPTSDAKVNIPCARCGAPLPCDGTTSLPTCEFCHTRTPLPEDVWRQLHATGMVHPFFLWATAKDAKEAAKKAVVFKSGGKRPVPYRAIIWITIGIPAVFAAAALGFLLFRAPNAAAVPHGFGKIHEACDGQQAACTTDGKLSLRCVDEVWAVALTCKGPKGCRVINDGESISCDYTFADLGDPCDVKDSACSTDRKYELKCDGTRFVAEDTCKGPSGCTMSPSHDAFTLSCDDHVADVGDACLDARFACASDKKSMLVCREGKFVTDHKCGGAGGCVATPQGDQTQMSCDEGSAKKRSGR